MGTYHREQEHNDQRYQSRQHEARILSRPSATSQEYNGNQSQSNVSIHNIIEQQSWESRLGISNNFDPERRGYTVSRDKNNKIPQVGDNHQARELGREEERNKCASKNIGRNSLERIHHQYNSDGEARYDRCQSYPYNGKGDTLREKRTDYPDDVRYRGDHQRRNNGPLTSYNRSDQPYPRHYGDRRPSSRENDNDRRNNGRDGRYYNHDRYNDQNGGGYERDQRYNYEGRFNNEHHQQRNGRVRGNSHDNGRPRSFRYATNGGGDRDGGRYQPEQFAAGDDDGWETVPRKADNRERKASRSEDRNNNWGRETPAPQITLIPANDSNRNFPQFMLLLSGIPGSGKSTFANSLVAGKPWMYVRVNQDTLGSRRACEDMTRSVLSEGKCPVIDRCNFNPSQRKHFLDIAASMDCPVDCVVFQFDMDLCIRRCQTRLNHETVTPHMAPAVVQKMLRDFYPPLPSRINAETFRSLKTIHDADTFNDTVMEYLNLIS